MRYLYNPPFQAVRLWIKTSVCIFVLSLINPAHSKTSLDGFFLFRTMAPQIYDQSFKSFFGASQFYLRGEFQPSNTIKTQMDFLLTKYYESEIYNQLEESFHFYPSAHWLIYDNIELKLGRNLYENKWDQFFSLNPYEPSWYSLDGLLLEYTTQRVDLDLWTAYLPKRWTGVKKVQDFKYGFGFFLEIDISENYMDSFNFHAAYLGDSFLNARTKKMSRYGLSVEGRIVRLLYRFSTIGHSSGLKFKLEETMYHSDLRYKIPNFFNTEIFIGYHTDSPSYNPWLYNRHSKAGRGDFLQWGNLSYYFIGASFLPWRAWSFQAAFYNFNATDKGSVSLGAFAPGDKEPISITKGRLGQEIDIQISSQITEEFELQLIKAFFLAQPKLFKKSFYNNIQLSALYNF